MIIRYWNPIEETEAFRHQLDRIFDEMVQGDPTPPIGLGPLTLSFGTKGITSSIKYFYPVSRLMILRYKQPVNPLLFLVSVLLRRQQKVLDSSTQTSIMVPSIGPSSYPLPFRILKYQHPLTRGF